MALPRGLLEGLQQGSAAEAWQAIADFAWEVCAAPITPAEVHKLPRRDQAVGEIDLVLATGAWELWEEFRSSVPRTADVLADWWAAQTGGRAVLILDGLSLRELPWLLQGAQERGFTIHQARATAAELPADTTPFAKALGFGQRSALENNGGGGTHRLAGARTETTHLPWKDVAGWVGAEPHWALWHHWPDTRIHDLASAGPGLALLSAEAAQQLTSDDFWTLVARLAHGRRLVITADHGYAASGQFPDAIGEQAKYLKDTYKSARSTGGGDPGDSPFLPPIDLRLDGHRFVLGRRKWPSQGGYPVLAHGGLSVLEVLVPFIELSRVA
ncbi:MAG TPA: hypothetical protein VF613_04285 [Longimicrobium sp.]|jgi:hypothetical protein